MKMGLSAKERKKPVCSHPQRASTDFSQAALFLSIFKAP